MTQLETDYLVIGSGAVSMAFVDTMLAESNASFIMVDRHHMPGGHWNDAYPFVRLHQPSAFYGVASRQLGSNRIDETGSNKGFYELASGAEVLAYFEQVMRERFLPSGRVQYFPMCEYDGGVIRSLMSSDEHQVTIRKKTVDGTFFRTSVPSTHNRKFEVAPGVQCIAPNELPRLAANYRHFTILGGGKTGMDAGVWLLDNGADPDAINWVCPRESWLINRETTQPGAAFFKQAVGSFATQLEAMRAAENVDDLFERLEAADVMLRIDRSVKPEMFHYATISHGEIEQLRRIKNVIRQGRVAKISENELVMQSGAAIPSNRETLYIDCTATAVPFTDSKTTPVFDGDLITLEALRVPLVTLSAAIIAFVEANFDNEAEKNGLCTPVGLADNPTQWMTAFVGNMINQNIWSQNPKIHSFIGSCRLDPFGDARRNVDPSDQENAKIMARIKENAVPAVMNLQKLIVAASP